ncbi:MAG TPA: hypothetical protein VF763_08850 [Candidatus Limnocylindrales bacterium]
MDRLRPEDGSNQEALDFVRYCYRRRRTGWPELYDEMCHVASRALYRGWGFAELAERGIGFSLFETARLAGLVGQVCREEAERRAHAPVAVMGPRRERETGGPEGTVERPVTEPETAPLRLVAVPAGAR